MPQDNQRTAQKTQQAAERGKRARPSREAREEKTPGKQKAEKNDAG